MVSSAERTIEGKAVRDAGGGEVKELSVAIAVQSAVKVKRTMHLDLSIILKN